MKLLVDTSSLLWQSLLAGQDKEYGKSVEHNGKKVYVNGWQFGLQCAHAHLGTVMAELNVTAADTIFVVAGQYSKSRRKAIYSLYKEERETRPPEAYVEFSRCKEELLATFLKAGAQVCTQDGVEEDDILGYLAKKLPGEIVILTRDGDMTTLIDERVSLYQNGRLTKENKYGPFPCKYVPVYKCLVGDGNEYKGAAKFGPKAFLDLLVWGGDGVLPALEAVIQREELHEMEDDVAEFPPMRKIIDSAAHVYQSYECALLHDEWVNTERQPLVWTGSTPEELKPVVKPYVKKNHVVFDCELIGTLNPVFLVCVHVLETGEKAAFWWHKEGEMAALKIMLARDDLTWVSFNGNHFDAPIVSAALDGKCPLVLKEIANAIIQEGGKAFHMPTQFGFDSLEFDHIDLFEVAPGVQISLKAYAGRIGFKTMRDLPFHHDKDLTPEECEVLETYCYNDLGVTEEMFTRLATEIKLREEMSAEHGIDLRSKSDAQVAEAVLKKAADIKGRSGKTPAFVTYKAPDFIQTDSDQINELIERIERTEFKINPANGQVESPDFLKDPMQLGRGTYQFGVGGLHSTHDKNLHVVATDEMLISDFDVSSYYPSIMIKSGITPSLDGGRGERFMAAYTEIIRTRVVAKRRMQALEKEIADLEKEIANVE